jgi:hypothetical protein
MCEEKMALVESLPWVAERLELRVAELDFMLDGGDSGLRLVPPQGHYKFLRPQTARADPPAAPGILLLHVHREPLPMDKTWGVLLCRTKIWELWQDDGGDFIFTAPRGSPPSKLVVDRGYQRGEVNGDFPASDGTGVYPLQGLDNLLCVNWLASYGDVILHASGLVIDGKGYAFLGPAGEGKSTLAASLAAYSQTTVLGEDQVILRYREEHFWIYGTPWHEKPENCSPLGAPLEKLFFLDRKGSLGVFKCEPQEGVTRVLKTAFIPYYRPELVPNILDRLALLAMQVPFYLLNYRLGSDVRKLVNAA